MLSAGQRQRILIARTLYRQADHDKGRDNHEKIEADTHDTFRNKILEWPHGAKARHDVANISAFEKLNRQIGCVP